MSGTATLKGRLSEVGEQIEAKRAEAQSTWTEFEQARDQFAAVDGDVKNAFESEIGQKAEEANKRYSSVAQELRELEGARDRLFKMIGEDGPSPDPVVTPDQHDERKRADHADERDPSDSPLAALKRIADRIAESKSREELVNSPAFKSERTPIGSVHIGEASRDEFKALITGLSDTSGGAMIDADRVGYVPQPRRPRSILDLITVGTTDSDAVEYARQTAFTNAAAEVAEATSAADGAKPEATIAFELVTAAVKTIAHWIPATRQSLSDAGQLRTIIESQLRYGLEYRLEGQIVSGGGTGANLTGITATSGILTQAKGADNIPDAIHKAITQIRLGFNNPNGVALHPNDWQVVRLEKDANGNYLYGPPAIAGTEMVWGLPVAVSPAVPDDTGIVGDFRQAVLWLREAIQILATDSHSDFFVRNLIAILAEMRVAFGVLMPTAFATVTGLD
jgi:HK97 family phage major capsid protein